MDAQIKEPVSKPDLLDDRQRAVIDHVLQVSGSLR
jgi:hypothetical protein